MNDVRKKWILTAILAVIEILMTVTDLGYFVIGSIAFTVLHIPVFIAVILAGLPQGFLIAGVFGLSSMINAYVFNDSLLGYLFQDPRISVVPRLMIPFAVWLAYKVICYTFLFSGKVTPCRALHKVTLGRMVLYKSFITVGIYILYKSHFIVSFIMSIIIT